MELLGLIAFAFVIYISIPKAERREDPLRQGPVQGTRKPRGPEINHRVKDAEWADGYVRSIAISGKEPLTDEDVRRAYGEIVNNDQLTNQAKYYLLDGLYQRTMNDHPHHMAAGVLEEISNESIALDHPNWHGRHGNWTSVKH